MNHHWPRPHLRQVATIIMGQAPPGDSYNPRGEGLPLFQGKAEFGDTYPTPTRWCTVPTRVADAGDILLSVRAPVGPTNLAPTRCCIGRGLAAVRARHPLASQQYLAYYFRFLEPILSRVGQGSTFAAINRRDVEALALPLPPPSEQCRIVEILDHANELRHMRIEAITVAQRITKAIFLSMFGDPVTTRRWPFKQLGDPHVGVLDRGRSQHRPRNAHHLYGGPYPFIQTGDVANSEGIIRRYTQTYSEEGLAQSRLWPAGTLCITIAANIAKTGILTFDACFPDSVVGFAPATAVTTEYVQTWFSFVQKSLEQLAPQMAQKNINLEILRNLSLPVPPVELQREFGRRSQTLYEIRADAEQSQAKLNVLFQTLMERAFSGSLTEQWRKTQMELLGPEMQEQARLLDSIRNAELTEG